MEGAALVISKRRDLNACVSRFAHTSHIQGVGYSIKSVSGGRQERAETGR